MRREGENRDDKDDQDDQPKHETLALVMIPGVFRATADGPLLSVEVPGEDRRTFPLTRNLTVIGRSANADVILSDPAISDYHARIIKHPFGYTVEDMGSAAGTFLHERPVNHARLVNGDVLRLGTIQVTFVDEQTGSQRKAAKNMSALVASPGISRKLKTLPRYAKSDEPDADAQRGRLPAKNGEDAEPSFEDLLRKILLAVRYLRRHARLILTLAVLGIGLGAASFKLLPPGQPARCVVTLYPTPKPNPLNADGNYQRPRSDEMSFFLGAENALVSTATILETLHQMGEVHAWEAEAQKIAKRMRVESLGSTGSSSTIAITLTPRMFDPRHDWYLQFLDTHVKSYLETEISKKLQVFVAEVDFLASQTAAADKRIREISEEAVKYHEAHSEQILMQSALASSPGDLETRRIALSSEISRLSGELEGVLSQLARGSALSQARLQSQLSDREALAGLDRRLTELRAQGFADGHPDVERILSQRKVLQKTMEEHLHASTTQLEKRSNLSYDGLQSQADQLQARLRAARAEMGFITANRRSLREVNSEAPKVNAHIEELNRQKEEAVRQYGLLSDRLNKAEVHLQLERVSAASRYEVVSSARFDWPAGRKVFMTRLGIGLGIGIFIAALVLGIGELRRAFARAARGLPATILLLALAGLAGCAHDGKFVWAADLPIKDEKVEPTVARGDTLVVEVQRQPTLSGEFLVREDGHYTQPVAGSIEAANKSPRQIAAAVTAALRGVVIDPVVSVWISKTTPIKISIVGEVRAPGSYELTKDRTLLSALARAGWVTEFAHLDRIFVVRIGSGERIRFRLQDITTAEPWAAQFQLSDSDAVVVE